MLNLCRNLTQMSNIQPCQLHITREVRWDSSQDNNWQAVITTLLWFTPLGLCKNPCFLWHLHQTKRVRSPVSVPSLCWTLAANHLIFSFPSWSYYQQFHITLLCYLLAAPLVLSHDEWSSGGNLPCDQPERSGYLCLQSWAACVLQSSVGPRHAE